VDTVTATDFLFTDEQQDDNSQEALLGLLDGCSALQYSSDSVHRLIDEANAAKTPAERAHAVQAAVSLAERFDRDRARLEVIVEDSIRDLDRRLREARFWPQFWRLFRRKLPIGSKPRALSDDDVIPTSRVDSTDPQLPLIKPDEQQP
jgi:hypothetical protein